MPHKKNPILSENLTGLARLIRSSVTPALENIVHGMKEIFLTRLLNEILDQTQL